MWVKSLPFNFIYYPLGIQLMEFPIATATKLPLNLNDEDLMKEEAQWHEHPASELTHASIARVSSICRSPLHMETNFDQLLSKIGSLFALHTRRYVEDITHGGNVDRTLPYYKMTKEQYVLFLQGLCPTRKF